MSSQFVAMQIDVSAEKALFSDCESPSIRSYASSAASSPCYTRSESRCWEYGSAMPEKKRRNNSSSEISTDVECADVDSSDADANCSRTSVSGSDASDCDVDSEPKTEGVAKTGLSADSLAAASLTTTYPVMLLLQLRAALAVGAAVQKRNDPVNIGMVCRTPALAASTDACSAVQHQSVGTRTCGDAMQDSSLSTEDFVRKVRSILNKLTVERFEVLYEQLASASISTPHHVAILVREVFEIATSQHNFIFVYADLCKRLEQDSRILAVSRTSPCSKVSSFRRTLLNQCQASFEEMLSGSRVKDIESLNSEEIEEQRARIKQRALGNIKFTARLLVLDMLSSKLLLTLSETLIDNQSACPDALECLAALLTVAGPHFDTDEWLSRSALTAIFDQVKGLTVDKAVPTRIRFLLRDVLELRAGDWVDKKKATTQAKGPMKLKEVRNEAGMLPQPSQQKSFSPDAAIVSSLLAPAPSAKNVQKKAAPVGHTGTQCPKAETKPPEVPYSRPDFHRELWRTLRDLSREGDVAHAASRIAKYRLPDSEQANEFTDLLTRAAEESNQRIRRSYFAFAARIVEELVFKRSHCLDGVENFFLDVYDDLCKEVPQLAGIVSGELVPALLTVVPQSELAVVVPPAMRCGFP